MLGVAFIVLYAAAVLTLWSMVIYLRAAWKVILERQAKLGEALSKELGPDAEK